MCARRRALAVGLLLSLVAQAFVLMSLPTPVQAQVDPSSYGQGPGGTGVAPSQPPSAVAPETAIQPQPPEAVQGVSVPQRPSQAQPQVVARALPNTGGWTSDPLGPWSVLALLTALGMTALAIWQIRISPVEHRH